MAARRQLEVERRGATVTITIDCHDEYWAIKLYDEIALAATLDHTLKMEIIATRPEDA